MRRSLRTVLSVLAPLCTASVLSGQIPLPPDVNLFGDEIVGKIRLDQWSAIGGIAPGTSATSTSIAGSDEAFPHVVVFQDGRQLRGEVVSITADEIGLRHPATSDPLRLPRREIRRIVVNPAEASASAPSQIFLNLPLEARQRAQPVHATVKLAGGDWVFGDVTSPDASNFRVKIGGRTELAIPRANIEWIQWDHQPAPAFGFAGSILDLDGWYGARRSTPWEVVDGVLEVDRHQWMARTIVPPARFEVALEAPVESENGIRLWLQPFEIANSLTAGTLQFQFGKSALTRLLFQNGFEERRSLLPLSAWNSQPSVEYRVLYDRFAERVAVLRNSQTIGDWTLHENAINNGVGLANVERQIRSISLDRSTNGRLRLRRLSVRPWNGTISKPEDSPPKSDLLCVGSDPPLTGDLNSLSGNLVVFSGIKKRIEPGMLLEFSHRPAALAGGDATLVVQGEGELRVANLQAGGGNVRFQSTSIPDSALPLNSLQSISLPASPEEPAPADVLVFKNGDELAGTLCFAAPGEPVRWQTNAGQKVDFKAERIAGVRFAVRTGLEETPAPVTVELRNGDRLRGKLEEIDGEFLKMNLAGVGTVSVKRELLWHLYPSSEAAVTDGSQSPEEWMERAGRWSRESLGDTSSPPPENTWVYLDGTYLPRSAATLSDRNEALTLEKPSLNLLDRFEVRCNVANARGGQPMFTVGLTGLIGSPLVQASCFFGQLHVMAMNGMTWHRANSFQVPLGDKLPNASSRVNMRVFVDAATGFADFYLDGVPVAQIGHRSDEHLPKLGARVDFQPYPGSPDPMIFSDFWIGPWTGELPGRGDEKPQITLNNGDVTAGAVAGLHGGAIVVATEIGAIELPAVKVTSVGFGGSAKPERTAARIRLANGSTVNVDGFRWEGDEFVAHSSALGDLRSSHGEISEWIPDPPAMRVPPPITAKPVTKKPPAGPLRARQNATLE